MLKHRAYFILLLSLCMPISSAHATIKFDIARSVGEILKSTTEQVGNTIDSAQKQLEHLKTYQKLVDGVKEGTAAINKIKAEVNEVKSAVEEAKQSMENLEQAVTKTTDLVEEATNLTADISNFSEESAQNAIFNGIGSIPYAEKLAELQKDLAMLTANFDVQISELQSEREVEIKKYEDNNNALQNYMKEDPSNSETYQLRIAENNEKIREIDDKYKQEIADIAKAFDEDNSELNEKIKELKEQAFGASLDVDDPFSLMNSGAIGNLFSGDAGAAMNDVIANNFYRKDEEDSAEGNKRLMTYRRNQFLEDAAEVYYQAVLQMSEDDKNIDMSNNLQSNAQVVDTTPAAIMLDLPIKIETMKRLLKYARLLTAEMKMATSKDMINMPKKLHNYDKDVTAFSIDDYAYADNKKGLLKKLKSLKQQAEQAKENTAAAKVGSTTVETVSATNIAATAKNKFAGIFRSIKTILYIISGFGLVGIAFQAIRGRLSWGWFAGLAAGLAILAATGAFVEYATGSNDIGGYFGDTATNAAGY